MKKLKLLQLNVTANWGSTGRIAEGIGQAALNRGWDSYIAYGRNMNPSNLQLIKVGNKLDVYAHYVRNRLLDGEGLGSKKPTNQLIKYIDQVKPNVIHLHNIHDHWLNYPILFDYLRKTNLPVVWTFHDYWAFTGGCAYFEKANCHKWKTGCGKCPLNKNLIDCSKENFNRKIDCINSIKNKLSIISVSNWVDSLVTASKLQYANKKVIYNGVDVTTLHPILSSRSGFNNKKVILGVANIWSESKGLKDYIKLRKLLDDRYIIVLVGLTNNEINQLPSGIIGLKRTNNLDELAKLYSRADVLVSFSRHETFGMTLAEAFACGTPAIAYDVTALPEVISKDTGFIVPLRDIEKVKDSVEKICSLDSDKTRISENCRKRAINLFNEKIQFNKYVDFYESLLK